MRRSVAFVLVLAALTAGCDRPRRAPEGRFSPPESGQPRVLATRVADDAARKHWKWSVLGDRSWVKASVVGSTIALTETYGLSEAGKSGGSPTWECDLSAVAGAGGWKWKLVVHGSNGVTATGSGTTSAIRVLATADTQTGLPASLRLAELAESPVVLQLAK